MIRFAIFYVPPSRSPFYRLGTSILRHDIRSQRLLHENNMIRAQIPNFTEKYVEGPQLSGLHSTITVPYRIRKGDLPSIEYEIEATLNNFSPNSLFAMQAQDDFVGFWGKNQEIVVLRYQPSPALLILHTILTLRLSALATGSSSYTDRNALDARTNKPEEIHRIRRYYSPHVLDAYCPHFTLMNPYTGTTHEHIAAVMRVIFGGFRSHTMDSICLMIQEQEGERWRIHREYNMRDYPKDTNLP